MLVTAVVRFYPHVAAGLPREITGDFLAAANMALLLCPTGRKPDLQRPRPLLAEFLDRKQ